jgi:hypothetical protein
MSVERVATDRAPASRDQLEWPGPMDPSIASHRVHDPAASIAAFGDPVWPLQALGSERAETLYFDAWPPGFQEFAKHVAYVLINHGMPETVTQATGSRAVPWPAPGTIEGKMSGLRLIAEWLAGDWTAAHPATPVQSVSDLDPHHLHDLREWILAGAVTTRTLQKKLSIVVEVWHLNPWLPDSCQWPDPELRTSEWQLRRVREENKTSTISADTFAPLHDWAVAFVTSFAGDILSGQRHYDERITALYAGAGSYVKAKAILRSSTSAAGLPGVPDWMPIREGDSPIAYAALEYRHRLPATTFRTSAYRLSWTGESDGVGTPRPPLDPALCALDVTTTGEFHGRHWVPYLSVYDFTMDNRAMSASRAVGHLRTACLIVIADLTGMRPDELLHLQRGAARPPLLRDDGSRLQLIDGTVVKGERSGENGSPPARRPATWASLPVTAEAVAVAERIQGLLGHTGPLLFGNGSKTLNPTRVAEWIQSFIEYVNARLVPHTKNPAVHAIPPDPRGGITLQRFRRTLAWHIKNQPNGSVTLATQYQQLGLVIGEGYAGTKESQMPDLLLEEDWAHRRRMAGNVQDMWDTGAGISGPAAGRALEAARKLPRHLTPADDRRLRKDPAITIYDNPAAIALCVYDKKKALCETIAVTGKNLSPDLLGCVDGCPNCARTDDHLDALRARATELRKAAVAQPIPMAQSMIARAEHDERLADEFAGSRILIIGPAAGVNGTNDPDSGSKPGEP